MKNIMQNKQDNMKNTVYNNERVSGLRYKVEDGGYWRVVAYFCTKLANGFATDLVLGV